MFALVETTIRIFNMSSDRSSHPSINSGYLFELGLPYVDPKDRVTHFAGPAHPVQHHTDDCVPRFFADPDLDIVAFIMARKQPNHEYDLSSFFLVPLSTIRAHCRSNADAQEAHIPWERWGPHGASWIKLISHPMNLAVSGGRAAISYFVGENMMEVVIFDVSRNCTVREDIPAFPLRSGCDVRWIHNETEGGVDGVRKQMSLPYRSFCRSLKAAPVEGRYEGGHMFFTDGTLTFVVRFSVRHTSGD